MGIIHIDEVDKLARRGGNEFGTWGGGRDVGGEGVQQALLRILEGTSVTISAKNAPISSNAPTASSPPSAITPGSSKAESNPYANDPPPWDPNNPMNRSFGAAPGPKKGVREGLPGYTGGPGGALAEGAIADQQLPKGRRSSSIPATSFSSSQAPL